MPRSCKMPSRLMIEGSKKKELNILLLGRSGIGKSTFVNASANYFAHENLSDIWKPKEPGFFGKPSTTATEGLKTVIPSKLLLTDHEGKDREFKHAVELNADGNESLEDLQSGTGGCKAYRFEFKTTIVNFIDTPGIVDTKGVEKDEKNVANILDFLSQFESLHGICILLRPDEDRLDAILRYSILELVGQLDVSAAKNIIFVFTNCNNTQFRLKGSRKAVEMIIQEIRAKKPEIHVPFSEENYFLFDSDAYNFLIANKNGIEYNDLSIATFNNSWIESRLAWMKMIKHVQTLPKYNVQKSVSIHKARRVISILSKPLGDVLQNISKNQVGCQERKEYIEINKGDVNKLRGMLFVPSWDLKYFCYKFPKIICGSINCTKTIIVNAEGESKTHYKQVCFEVDEYTPEDILSMFTLGAGGWTLGEGIIFGLSFTARAAFTAAGVGSAIAALAIAVKGAKYFHQHGFNCSTCPCSLKTHKLALYGTREVDTGYEDEGVRERIHTTEDCVREAEAVLTELEWTLEELDTELKCIQEASTKFTVFLKTRSLAAYNYAFEDYLKRLIEAAKAAPTGSRNEAYDLKLKLEQYSQQHNENVKRIEESKSSSFEDSISPKDIELLVQQLCNLKRSGPFIKDAVDGLTTSQINLRGFSTVKVECKVPSFEID